MCVLINDNPLIIDIELKNAKSFYLFKATVLEFTVYLNLGSAFACGGGGRCGVSARLVLTVQTPHLHPPPQTVPVSKPGSILLTIKQINKTVFIKYLAE